MTSRRWLVCGVAAALPALLAGCFDEPPLPESGVPVFDDAFTAGFTPNAFEGSLLTSLSVDDTKAYSGSASIRLEVPGPPSYSGGAVLASSPQDLSETNALVFWATASRAASINELGFGLNFDPFPSTWRVTLNDLPLGPEWTRHLVPIPDPSKVTAERGMFWWADADTTSYRAWLDEVKFDRVDPAVMNVRPESGTAPRTLLVGGTARVGGLRVTYDDFDGTRRSISAPGYFSFTSSDGAVATVDGTGLVTGVGLGDAVITVRLGGVAAPGGVPVKVVSTLPTAPAEGPPRPTQTAETVISLLSAAYPSHPVSTWRTDWRAATLADVTVGDDPLKRYGSLDFVGVEFPGPNVVDGSTKGFLHLDVWTPDATAVRVKLVDYGADRVGGGGDDSEHELVFDQTSSPDLATGSWIGLDLPLSRFAGLTSRAHLGLLVLSALPAGSATVFVGNVYFHD